MSQCRGFSIQDIFPEVVLNSAREFSNALVKLNPTYAGRWVLKSIFGIPQLVLDSVEVKFLRSTIPKTNKDKISNEEIRKEAGIEILLLSLVSHHI
uniref:Uncharacterized protein n=1 Tax=Timema shepardi TaxID=629360 RepID=A0A7R9FW60_TIMSH|nr:unnamed protein product [Timema shepardi]